MNHDVPHWEMEATKICNNYKDPSNGDSWSDSLPMWDYEVAELTWQNGQPGMHGLGAPKLASTKPSAAKSSVWDRPQANGTLECIVNQGKCMPKALEVPQLRDSPLFSDATVPCSVSADATPDPSWVISKRPYIHGGPCDATLGSNFQTFMSFYNEPFSSQNEFQQQQHMNVGEHSDQSKRQRLAIVPEISHSNANLTISGSENPAREDTYATYGTGEEAEGITTPVGSVDNTSTAKDEQDSVCHSRSKMEENENPKLGKGYGGRSSTFTRRSRAAAVHNQSERKRRDRINQKMKALQKLLPNSSKTDKASVLDEVIEYLKQLQATVQLMGQSSMHQMMMMPIPMQQLQMGMLAQMGTNAGIWPVRARVPHILSPCNFMPQNLPVAAGAGSSNRPKETMSNPSLPDPGLSNRLAYQPQNMTLDPFKMAALYQQMYQHPSSNINDLGKP